MIANKNQPFFLLALKLGFIFLIVITVIKIIFSIFDTGSFAGMVEANFSESAWPQFVKIQVVISAIYGLFMAGYYKLFKKK